jgi:hypothetical protein
MTTDNDLVSVNERPEYVCPNCGGTRFELSVHQYVQVDFTPNDENPHTVIGGPEGDMEWDSSTYTRCLQCGKDGELCSFEPEDQE